MAKPINKIKYSCKHYKRNCLIKTSCCKKEFNCHLCHDEVSKHIFKRFLLKQIRCKLCFYLQSPSKKCKKCLIIFSRYFCKICYLWTNNKIYHCKECGVCKIGLKNNNFHCSICNTCMPISLLNNHKHIENIMDSNCIICSENMFNSIINVSMLSCGHTMHEKCLEIYSNISSLCPICKKTIGNFNNIHKRIKEVLKIYKGTKFNKKGIKGIIKCLDCNLFTYLTINHVFNRCGDCKSYNTILKKET